MDIAGRKGRAERRPRGSMKLKVQAG
ncbi:hypothetical protein QQF64_020159, partial [Cirrhinus molitorella]